MLQVGLDRTGNMGNPTAAKLVRAGHQPTVHDPRREAATNLLEMGAQWALGPKGALPGNEVAPPSLPVPRDVEAVAPGENGTLEAAADGTVHADLSTDSPAGVRRLHRVCADSGVSVLDAPVDRGVEIPKASHGLGRDHGISLELSGPMCKFLEHSPGTTVLSPRVKRGVWGGGVPVVEETPHTRFLGCLRRPRNDSKRGAWSLAFCRWKHAHGVI